MSSEAVMSRVLSTANKFVGTRYQRGGNSPSSGFDAAGFVRYVFSRFGVILPRTAGEQARVGDAIDTDWRVIVPGDLLMFKDDDGIHHVAIYAGRNRIIHSTQTGGGVRYDDLSTERGQWFLDHLVAARRVTPDLRGLLLDLARGVADDASAADEPDSAPRPSGRRRQ
jgi:N-acetylmuramoyl-L-alanine amidase